MLSMIRYHLILNLRERTMVFWTLAFPLLLGVFFYFGLGGIDEASAFSPVPVAIVQAEDDESGEADAEKSGDAKDAETVGTHAENSVSVSDAGDVNDEAEIPDKMELFGEFMDGISGEVVEPVYVTEFSEASQMLEDGEISGIFDMTGEDVCLTVGETGLDESILTALLSGFEQQTAILSDVQEDMEASLEEKTQAVEDLAAQLEELGNEMQTPGADVVSLQQEMETVSADLEAATQEVSDYAEEMGNRLSALADSMKGDSADYVQEVSLGGRNVSSVAPYYFALVAMACLYMCFLGETAARRTQANISEIGKRISLSPVHRMKIVISNGISAYAISLVNIAIVFLFLTKIVHGLDISMYPGYAALTAMIGCLIGVTFGILIESIGKWSQNMKSAILIGSSVFCAFLAGLMISDMKDIIEKHVPIVNRINPAALIADSFYCICVYDDMGRLQMNLIIMAAMSGLFLVAAWLLTRRVRYDNL